MPQVPFEQAGVPPVELQVLLQLPHVVGLARSASQPFEGLPSQFW